MITILADLFLLSVSYSKLAFLGIVACKHKAFSLFDLLDMTEKSLYETDFES